MYRTSKKQLEQQRTLHQNKGLKVIKIPSLEKDVQNFIRFLSLAAMIATALFLTACSDSNLDDNARATGSNIGAEGDNSHLVSEVRYPTNAYDFSDDNLLYGGRDFLNEYNDVLHLGRDLKLKAGTPIHPIARGKLVLNRPADGYGDLAVVIEHELKEPMTVTNGDGGTKTISKFLSIYGHGTKQDPMGVGPDLNLQVGQMVNPSDVIMYIQIDDYNGDGPEHLHFGIRIQSQSEAEASDPKAWFRGYDYDGNYKKYYTWPGTFLPLLAKHVGYPLQSGIPVVGVTHHPIGSLLFDKPNNEYWLVVEEDQIFNVTSYNTLPRECSVLATAEELACYRQTAFHKLSIVLDATVIKFDGLPEVYRLYPGAGFDPTGFQVFLSYESFLSWGYRDTDLLHYPASEKPELLSALSHEGGVGMMSGALVKGFGESEVSVSDQHGTRRPIFNWDIFLDLGYAPNCIYEIEPSTLDVVAGARSTDLITTVTSKECPADSSAKVCSSGTILPCDCGGIPGSQVCLDDGKSFGACVCEPGPGGGGSGGASQGSDYCKPPGAFAYCDEICPGGIKVCQDDYTLGSCECPETGGSGGSGGTPQPECASPLVRDCTPQCPDGYTGLEHCVNEYWSGQCVCEPLGSTGGSGGSAGSSGSSGTSGSAGSGGSTTESYLVELEFEGPSYSMDVPDLSVGWMGTGVQDLGCQSLASKKVLCSYQMISMSQVSTIDGQIQLTNWGANDLYWGDASGNSYSVCLSQAEIDAMHSDCLTINGTICMRVNGLPHNILPCSNGYPKSGSCMDCCDESPQEPYFNFCAD